MIEIDAIHYCRSFEDPNGCHGYDEGRCKKDKWYILGKKHRGNCKDCLHKWPTPEQYEEEYDRAVPDGIPVWIRKVLWAEDMEWRLYQYNRISNPSGPKVVSCTPWGKPPDDWKPV